MKYSASNYLKFILIICSVSLFMIKGNSQLEIYPSINNWSSLDLNYGTLNTVEIDANTSFPDGRGSEIVLHRFNSDATTDPTIRLRAATNNDNTFGNYGSLRLDAYTMRNTIFDADNKGIQSAWPYAMISLVRHTDNENNAAQDFSWNIGVFDAVEWVGPVSGFDPYDCEDCLTFAYQDGVGTAYYKYAFGADGSSSITSDVRLKENIIDIESSLEKILRLSPKNYNYIWNEKKVKRKSTGFLAQEVQKLFPNLVSSIIQPNGERTLMLNYVGMIPYITKGMQEQQDIISNQDEQITELHSMISELSAQIKELQGLNKK